MGKTLEWSFELDDRVSGPAKKMDAALAPLEARLHRVDENLRKLEAPSVLGGGPSTAIAPKQLRQAKKAFSLAGDARGPQSAWMRDYEAQRAEAARVAALRGRMASSSSVEVKAPSTLSAPGTHKGPAWMQDIGAQDAMRKRRAELNAFATKSQNAGVQVSKAYQKILNPPPAKPGPFADLGKGLMTGLGGGVLLAGVAGVAAFAASKLVELGAKAVELIHAGVAFGVEAAGFRESTTTGFKLMTGSAELGAGLMDESLRFARMFGMSSQKVSEEFRSILAAKFTTKEVPIVFQALHDVDATGGNSQALLGSMAVAKQAKRIHYEDVKSMASAANVDFNDVFDAMAKKYKRSRLQLVRHLQGEIGLDPMLGVQGVIAALTKKKGGGALGTGIAEIAGDLDSQLVVLRDTLMRVGASNIPTPGFDLFKSVITGLNASLAEGTPGADKLAAIFTHLDGILTGLFSRWSGKDGMAKLAEDVDALLTRLERLAAIVEKVAAPVGKLLSYGTTAVLGPTAHSTADEKAGGAALRASTIATIPFLGPLLSLTDTVMGGAGTNAPPGTPKMANGGIVDRPTLAEVGHGREAIVPLTKGRRLIDDVLGPGGGEGGGKTIIIRPELNLTITVSGGEDAELLAEKLEPRVRRIVEDVMEDAAREFGAEVPA